MRPTTTFRSRSDERLADVVPLALEVRGRAEDLLDVLFGEVATDPTAEHAWRLAGSLWESADELVAQLTGTPGPYLEAA